MSLVEIERDGPVALLRLNRPAKLNALSSELESALLAALADPTVQTSSAVVLAGAGRAFSAGADLTEVRSMAADAVLEYYRASGRVYEALAGLAQPTVAALHGYCLGGGFELALAADFRVADDTAVLGFPEVGLGILPSSGGTLRVVRALGPLRARELILLGRRLDARAAAELGLLTEVVAAGAAPARATELAAQLAGLAPEALQLAGRVIDAVPESSAAAALLAEQLAYATLNARGGAR